MKSMWPLMMEDCDVEVAMDVSDFTWGIYWNGHLHSGKWLDADALLHINVKEIITLKIFLTDFLPSSYNGCSLLWRTDSLTSLAYIRKEGGTVSPMMLTVARDILLLHRRKIRILPVFIKSEENLQADAASRFIELPDWHLPTTIFNRICNRWSTPEIDIFATQHSTHLPRFFAWGDDEGAEAYDALAQFWDFRLAYAFPPPQILLRVLKKIASSEGTFILVTPFWPAQKWFTMITDLRVEEVRRLTEIPPVTDLKMGLPPTSTLPLVSWKIFGGCTASTSPRRHLAFSEIVGGCRQESDTQRHGDVSGVSSLPNLFLSIPQI